jgi:hypothetical protein
MTIEGYDFGSDSFAELLLRKFFPEKTQHETKLLLEYLVEHQHEFERCSVSVRIGAGLAPDPSHVPGVQRNTERSSRRRIDFVGWFGNEATLVEAKTRIGHAVLGQLLSDRILWGEEFPDAPEPRLVAIGRTSDEDSLRILASHGIDVYLYPPSIAE